MNDERLAELKEKYKNRNLLEELAWGIYWNHSGYTSKQNGEFLNWLCLMAYRSLKERLQGDLISREALRNTILNDHKLDGSNANWEVNRILVHIDNAPAVVNEKLTTERSQGEWIIDQEETKNTVTLVTYTCPFCGERHCCKMNFCGNCGAELKGKEE